MTISVPPHTHTNIEHLTALLSGTWAYYIPEGENEGYWLFDVGWGDDFGYVVLDTFTATTLNIPLKSWVIHILTPSFRKLPSV